MITQWIAIASGVLGVALGVGQIGCVHERCCSRPSDFRDIRSRTGCSQAQLTKA